MSMNYTQEDEVRYEDIQEETIPDHADFDEDTEQPFDLSNSEESRDLIAPRRIQLSPPANDNLVKSDLNISHRKPMQSSNPGRKLPESKIQPQARSFPGQTGSPVNAPGDHRTDSPVQNKGRMAITSKPKETDRNLYHFQRQVNQPVFQKADPITTLPKRLQTPSIHKSADDGESQLTRSDKYRPEENEKITDHPVEGANISVKISAETSLPEWYILEELITNFQPLPEGTIILGVDNFGKPLVLSLDDDSFGALLFLGDNSGFNRKHILSVLKSAEELNNPDLLQIDVITPSVDSYASNSSNLRKVCSVEDDGIFTVLGDYLTEIEDRLRTKRRLPFQILVLDQVETLSARLAEESLRFLRWIIRRGPQAGIWPLASIDSESLEAFDIKTYKSFGFHLYGKMTKQETIHKFTKVSPEVLKSLSPGSQGCFLIETDLISFSIPELAN